jgi:hypothetical protein
MLPAFEYRMGGISAILPVALTVSLLELWGVQDLPIKYPERMMSRTLELFRRKVYWCLITSYIPTLSLVVSPLAALGLYYNLQRIMPAHINRDAARNLI